MYESMHIGTCLLCLAVDRRTLDIARSQLLNVYEKITDFKIKSDSHRLCFICHTRLWHAHQLRQLAKRTQHLLIHFNTNKFEKSIGTHKSLVELSRCHVAEVEVAPVPSWAGVGGDASVKDEPTEVAGAQGDGKGSSRRLASGSNAHIVPPEPANWCLNKPNTRATRRRQREDVISESSARNITLERLPPGVSASPADIGSNAPGKRDVPRALGGDTMSAGVGVGVNDAESTREVSSDGTGACPSDVVRVGHDASEGDSAKATDHATGENRIAVTSAGDESAAADRPDARAEDDSFPCRFCPFRSVRPDTLRRHERAHAGPRRYWCAHCDRPFPHKGNYMRHLRTHTGDRPYSCEVCSSTFAQLSTLNAHRLVHTGERPFECGRCGARFGRRGVLQRHEATHTGVKPHRCAECGMRFTRKSCLVDHERTHVGVRPRRFFRRTDLNQHRRTHTGAKPYACDRCERRFAHKTSLVNHHRTHTGDRPYCCSVCRRTFKQRSNLLRHERSHSP